MESYVSRASEARREHVTAYWSDNFFIPKTKIAVRIIRAIPLDRLGQETGEISSGRKWCIKTDISSVWGHPLREVMSRSPGSESSGSQEQ